MLTSKASPSKQLLIFSNKENKRGLSFKGSVDQRKGEMTGSSESGGGGRGRGRERGRARAGAGGPGGGGEGAVTRLNSAW